MAEKPERPILHLNKGRGAAKKVVEMDLPVEDENLSSIAAEIIAPTEVSIREISERIEEAFKALGTDKLPGTIIPVGTSKNNGPQAAEYVLADMLVKLATQRMKDATEAAEKAGVFGDPDDYVQGRSVMVYNDPNFSINIKMGRPSLMVKKNLVQQAAERHLGKKASEFMDECKGERAATKQIIVSMK